MMEFSLTSILAELSANSVLFWSLFACGFAQVSKLFITLLLEKEFRLKVLVETGGMPSSHAALVTATASGIGIQLGFNHPTFALAASFAFNFRAVNMMSLAEDGPTRSLSVFIPSRP